jgi:hypothetical protein
MLPDSVPRALILAGFLINTGAPPFSSWVPDSYSEASTTGMVFLSAFTTKTAVYVLARGFPGAEILIVLGLIMIFYGIFYGLAESQPRRMLGYSIVNQVGFMLVGIGIGTELAVSGAVAHAFAHIHRGIHAGDRHQHHKLFAPKAGQHIALAQCGAQAVCQVNQGQVTKVVPMPAYLALLLAYDPMGTGSSSLF